MLAPNPVGDAVMFTPTIRAVRTGFPDAELTLLARPAAAAVLTPNPWGARVLVESGRLRETAAALRGARADLIVIGPNSFRGGVLARLSGAARRVGYARDGRGWLLTDRLRPPRGPNGSFAVTPAIDYYLALAERLGCDATDRRMALSVADADAASADDLLARKAPGDGPLVLLNPGAAFGGSKLYPAGRFAAVADALVERHDARIVINAGPGEGEIAAAVAKSMNHAVATNLADERNSLGLVKAIAARSDLMITNDTGPRHFAAAFGVPVVTIFGATDPGWTTIYYDRERIVRVDVPCGPCQQKECRFPPDHPEFHQCMLKIPPEMVLAAAEELLRDRPPAGTTRGA